MDVTEEFIPNIPVLLEGTPETTRGRAAPWFLDSPHHHAHVTGLHHHRHTTRLQDLLHSPGDLLCQTLLHLETTGEHLRDPGQLAQTQDSSVREIGDVDLPEKWHEVMFAEGEDVDVPDHDHLAAVLLEDRIV